MSNPTKAVTDIAHSVADNLFDEYGTLFEKALDGYRGHVHRVIELTANQIELNKTSAELLGISAFFHDASIWMDDTFDYLAPSIDRARQHLFASRHVDPDGPSPEHADLVEAIIDEHHRQRRAKHHDSLVEAFRRADLTDVSFGIVPSPGTSRTGYRSLLRLHPSAGFRRGLIVIFVKWAAHHPLRPLPMVKF